MRSTRCFVPTRRSSLPAATRGFFLNAASLTYVLARARGLRDPGILDRSGLDRLHRVGEFAIARLRYHPTVRNLPAVDVAEVTVIDLGRIQTKVRVVVVHETFEHARVLLEERLNL